MAGVRQIVDGPEFSALPDLLWETAQHPSTSDPHWQQGVTWIEQCGAGGTTYDECLAVTGTGGTPAAPDGFPSTVTQTSRGATPFTVYAAFECSAVGRSLDPDSAERSLLLSEGYQTSRAFWTGIAGSSTGTAQRTVYPHLAANATLNDPQGIRLQTAATPLVTGGEDPSVALGQLESSLATCYGGQGVIHIPTYALPTFASRMLVEPGEGGMLRTLAGNLVVSASGYTGSSPAGADPAAGTAWVYATGALIGYRSDVSVREFPQTFDRSENTVKALATRTYLFGFECCHYAALVDLGVPT